MGSNISVDMKKTPAFRCETHSEKESLAVAKTLGHLLRPGDWIALIGELGTGKTVFAQGLAEALGCREPARSPTFVLIQTYRPKSGGRATMHHVDLFRLPPGEIPCLAWEDLLSDDAVTVVEWAEKAMALWPPFCLPVHIDHLGEDRRAFRFYSVGDRSAEIVRALKSKKAVS